MSCPLHTPSLSHRLSQSLFSQTLERFLQSNKLNSLLGFGWVLKQCSNFGPMFRCHCNGKSGSKYANTPLLLCLVSSQKQQPVKLMGSIIYSAIQHTKPMEKMWFMRNKEETDVISGCGLTQEAVSVVGKAEVIVASKLWNEILFMDHNKKYVSVSITINLIHHCAAIRLPLFSPACTPVWSKRLITALRTIHLK